MAKKATKYIVRVTVTTSERVTKAAVRDLVQRGVGHMIGEKIGEKSIIAAKAGAVDEQ